MKNQGKLPDNSAAAHASQRKTYYEKMTLMAQSGSVFFIIGIFWLIFDLLSRPGGWIPVVALVALVIFGLLQKVSS